MAATALISATCDPTDRSMPAVMMTKVMATATTRIGAACRRMFSRLAEVRNTSVITAKNTTQSRKKPAIDSTCACSARKSAIAEPCPRSVY